MGVERMGVRVKIDDRELDEVRLAEDPLEEERRGRLGRKRLCHSMPLASGFMDFCRGTPKP